MVVSRGKMFGGVVKGKESQIPGGRRFDFVW